jgi:hypothetical protein
VHASNDGKVTLGSGACPSSARGCRSKEGSGELALEASALRADDPHRARRLMVNRAFEVPRWPGHRQPSPPSA